MNCNTCQNSLDANFGIFCIHCKESYHINCVNCSHFEEWVCPHCLSKLFPFYNIIDQNEYIQTIQGYAYTDSQENDKCFDVFVLNNYNIEEICLYYYSNSFADKIHSYVNANTFSIFHLNAQSLCSKFFKIQDFLESLHHQFSIYGYTETWFKENPLSLYNIPNYTFIQKPRTGRTGGGVCLYIKDSFQFIVRNDLSFSSNFVDSLFIEIEQSLSKNIIVGIIYRAPNSDPLPFINSLETCVNHINIENKLLHYG